MKYHKLLPLLATLLLINGCDQLQTALNGGGSKDSADSTTDAATAAPGGKVLATVNGTAISQDVFDVYNQSRKPQPGGDAANSTAAVLQELVALELMRQEGDKNGVASRPKIVALFDQQKRTALASAAINDFVAANQPSDEVAQQTYNTQMGQGGKEFNARHILLATPEAASEVITSLDGGADFSELAMEKSTGPSGKNGGKLGWFAAGQMVKPFSDATALLEVGSYGKEPVQTRFGWHVIILDDVREITPPPFEDVKARLKLLMANQKLQAHIGELKAAADISISVE